MQEVGLNWSLLTRKNNWQTRVDRSLKYYKTRTKLGFNTLDKTGNVRQWGGTGVFSHGKLFHYSAGAGCDPLGRWTWAKYQGKGGVTLRVISIYRPCSSKEENSVFQQQKCALQELNDDRNPRDAFLEDLREELRSWCDAGDQLVVGGDVNESVFHHSITNLFNEFNMRNLIFAVHDRTNAPQSYFNTTEGRIVDGLWGTAGLQVTKCGYLEPRDFVGNHSLMWADISCDNALGHSPVKPISPDARRLQPDFPITVKRYLKSYREAVSKYCLHERQLALEASTSHGVHSLHNNNKNSKQSITFALAR